MPVRGLASRVQLARRHGRRPLERQQLDLKLATYDAREAEPGGLYEVCDRLTGDEASSLLAALRAMPGPPVPPHANGRETMNAVRRALTRAGYDLHD